MSWTLLGLRRASAVLRHPPSCSPKGPTGRQSPPLSNFGKTAARSSSWTTSRPASDHLRSRRRLRRTRAVQLLGVGVGLVATTWLADRFLFASSLERSLRTLIAGALLTYEYKVNFVPGKFEQVHKRAADLILDTCTTNGGLYIKFAQQIASVSAVLPKEWSDFKRLYDRAPTIPFSTVEALIKRELRLDSLDQLFESFDPVPVASASIAQVHRARLCATGELVAVKVQKPEIERQMGMDLLSFKIVTFLLERIFDLPLYWSADYIEHHIRQEIDFVNEARNAERCEGFIAQVDNLRDRVHVPRVHWSASSRRILTCEWIDGVQFGDVNGVKSLGHSLDEIMTTVIELFSDQIFRTGFVHCDPHPGNILIRAHPTRKGKPEIVLLDHGLYVQATPSFTHNYALVWKSLFTNDTSTLETITKSWGIRDTQLFASGTLQRPYMNGSAPLDARVSISDVYEMQIRAKERAKTYLSDTDRVPRELIFVGRNLNIVRSNNKVYGSPVNRINIMARCAVRSLGDNWSIAYDDRSLLKPVPEMAKTSKTMMRLRTTVNLIRFNLTLLSISFAFHLTRLWQALRRIVLGASSVNGGGGFEDVMDEVVRRRVYEQTGVWLEPDAFDA